VSIDAAPWSVECPGYDPPYFVAPEVLANDRTRVPGGWADPEDVTLLADMLAVPGVSLDRSGRPLHPYGRTGIAGRGALGRWGPNVMVVALITRAGREPGDIEVLVGAPEASEALVLPRDFVRSGEEATAAMLRVLEAASGWRLEQPSAVLASGYDYDPRRTDHAWVVTHVHHAHVGGAAPDFFRAGPGFESVAWHVLDAPTINRIPAASARHARAAVRALADAGLLTQHMASTVLARSG
jgi:ADP-ribose pyrophosphatase